MVQKYYIDWIEYNLNKMTVCTQKYTYKKTSLSKKFDHEESYSS